MRSPRPQPRARASARPKSVVGAVQIARRSHKSPAGRALGTHIVSATFVAYRHAFSPATAGASSLASSPAPRLAPRRRVSRPWQRVLLISLLGCAFGLAWGFWWEPQRLVVTRAELNLPGWPRELSGLKVALLSDLHVGSPFWDLPALARLVERTNAEKPDLVLLAGDYQINDVRGGVFVGPEAIAHGLAPLRAPLGVFAVLGNHDWWNNGGQTRQAFEANGIVVLEESSRRIEHAGAAFFVVGLADQLTRPSNPTAALAMLP